MKLVYCVYVYLCASAMKRISCREYLRYICIVCRLFSLPRLGIDAPIDRTFSPVKVQKFRCKFMLMPLHVLMYLIHKFASEFLKFLLRSSATSFSLPLSALCAAHIQTHHHRSAVIYMRDRYRNHFHFQAHREKVFQFPWRKLIILLKFVWHSSRSIFIVE